MNIPLQFRKCLVLRDLEESEYSGTDEINSLPTPAQINDCLIKWLATSCSTLMSGKDVDVDGVRRCFRTATANKTTVHLTGYTWVWRDTVEWYWQGKTEDLRENHIPVTRCPPQIPHRLTWARTRGSAVRYRRLTPWAMARFQETIGILFFVFILDLFGALTASFSVCSFLGGKPSGSWR
jgi:hypothetical protein